MESRAPVEPAWDPLPAAGVRLGVGALVTAAAFVALAVCAAVGIALVAAASGSDTAQLAARLVGSAGDPRVLAALAASQVLFLVLAGGVSLAVLSPRQLGLSVTGTLRSVRLAMPVLIVFAGVPAAWTVATGGTLVHDSLGVREVALVVLLVVAIGLVEEIVFRGVLVSVLGGAAAPLLAAGASSVLFGLLHIGNGGFVNPVVVVLAVGVPFALVRVAGGSILGLALIHALLDLYAILQLGGVTLPTDTSRAEQALVLGPAGVICAAYVLWFMRTQRGAAPTDIAPASSPG